METMKFTIGESVSVRKTVELIHESIFALPSFQRDYVWMPDRVKKLVISLYEGLPCGAFLFWDTNNINGHTKTIILDGQQRLTSLYYVITGMPPQSFKDTNSSKELKFDLWFNTDTQKIEEYNKKKMDTPFTNWVRISDVLSWKLLGRDDELYNLYESYNNRGLEGKQKRVNNIIRLLSILEYKFPVYRINRDTKLDEIITIFNRINTGGKVLNETDIAIAKLCGQWDDAKREIYKLSRSFGEKYEFSINIILRCITAFLTGSPRYKELDNTTIDDFAASLPIVRNMIGTIIDNLRTRLGLDNSKVIASKYSFVTLVYYIKTKGEKNITHKEWNKMLYWYIHSMLWGRYSSSLISNLAYDLNTIAEGGGIEELIETIKRDRGGNLTISPDDFINRGTTQSTFYPLLYMLTRVHKAKDFAKGIQVDSSLLAANSSLEVHHIFPQSRLRSPISTDKHKQYKEELINNIANYALITAQTNQSISNRDPKDYFNDYLDILPTQWIPTEDKSLWEYENYEKFLSARRTLLADAANKLLEELNQ